MNTEELGTDNAVRAWRTEYGAEAVAVADMLCDRYACAPEKVALFYENEKGENLQLSFAQLSASSAKMAGFLKSLGIRKGDRIAVMLPKTPELVIAALAIWRLGAVYLPLFTAFGPEAINYRLKDSGARALVTDVGNRTKILEDERNRDGLQIITVAGPRESGFAPGDFSFWEELESAVPLKQAVIVSWNDLLVLIYTSGTTGHPKGCEMPVKSLAAFEAYMRYGLDLQENDVYWNIADPGWAYGLYYNLIGTLLMGKTILFYHAPFNPAGAYHIMEKYQVTNLTGAPTAYKVIMGAGEEMARKAQLHLRVLSSAGEPLNPHVIKWAKKMWGLPIYDHYGQTEGGMMLNNHHFPGLDEKIKPGSMGRPMPGYKMVVLNSEGQELANGQRGELAVDLANSPLFGFRHYWQNEKDTKEKFTGDGRYYLTGDIARVDIEGHFYFVSRSDDIILSAGYRIGPFEIENVLMQHEAVLEAAVIGVPDELRGEIVKAFVVLKPGSFNKEALAQELQNFVKKRLSAHAYPKQIEFLDQIPRTSSGKIQRYLLRRAN
ncbi:AMP-binding protein [Candidatus Formimonas warabiya]|uniref:AMP-dependent synthetase n=1 Tax=Formimonas warabiya TaxID=1761012 RepID=A0A3G1KYM1_FORW1|nr:AMP-binding protein [Candidatus Formimonas warabiya]ATW27500.1 AMP-dependent synthetase [Candidatus Formimonas warabiya]